MVPIFQTQLRRTADQKTHFLESHKLQYFKQMAHVREIHDDENIQCKRS